MSTNSNINNNEDKKMTGQWKKTAQEDDFAEELPPEVFSDDILLDEKLASLETLQGEAISAPSLTTSFKSKSKHDTNIVDAKRNVTEQRLEEFPPEELAAPPAPLSGQVHRVFPPTTQHFIAHAAITASTSTPQLNNNPQPTVFPGAFSVPGGDGYPTNTALRRFGNDYDENAYNNHTNNEESEVEDLEQVIVSHQNVVEAERVVEPPFVVAEPSTAESTTSTTSSKRWFYLWMLFTAMLIIAVVVTGIIVAVVVVTSSSSSSPAVTPALATNSPITAPPTTAAPTNEPVLITPLGIACQFLQEPTVTSCQSLTSFESSVSSKSVFGTSIPSEIGLLTQLTYLQVSREGLTGSIPSDVSKLTLLVDLNLRNNALTGSIPSSLSNLTQLTSLSLNGNALTGSISSSLSSWTQLASLDLSNNFLTGSIPSSLSSWTQLKELYSWNNSLTGSIPSSISSWTQLERLYLEINSLTGSIPSSLSSLSQLRELWLYNNQLTGLIPFSLASSLTQLAYVSLSNNSLTGSIPSSLSSLTQLSFLHLYDNALTGSIPSSLCSLGLVPKIDCREIRCICCTNSVENACLA